MTIPKKWNPGDPISAARLNEANAESVRSRRDITLGDGSSMVNESMGNQSSIPRSQFVKLVVAVEDFAIQEVPTDVKGGVDDVPSGLVKEVRLNRKSSIHSKDEASRPFRVYDVIGGLSGNLCVTDSNSASASTSESASPVDSKLTCDVFYVMFNHDSKRWEVLEGGGGIQLYHGVIIERCNQTCSTYRVQRVHRYITAGCGTCSDSSSESAP